MNTTIPERIEILKKTFSALLSPEEKYTYLIELGRTLAPYPADRKNQTFVVPGCQSTLYLATTHQNGKLFFSADCDALISKGLAALLITIYSDATPQTILLNPPAFLYDLGIFASLSPSRSNGLASIYTRMKNEALKALTPSSVS